MFEKLKLVYHNNLIYIIAEPDEDAGSPYFSIYAVNIMTGETQSSFKVPCSHGYAEVSFMGHHLFWQEQDILKWTPIDKRDVKTISIKVIQFLERDKSSLCVLYLFSLLVTCQVTSFS